MNERILTLNGPATREAIRIKFYSPNRYVRGKDINYATLYRMLTGSLRYNPDPASVYQGILRHLLADGVLVEADQLQEAA